MRRISRPGRRLISIILSLAMVFGLVPNVQANDQQDQEAQEIQYEIVAFAELDEKVATRVVAIGTALGKLGLPETLTADCLIPTATEETSTIEPTVTPSETSEQGEVATPTESITESYTTEWDNTEGENENDTPTPSEDEQGTEGESDTTTETEIETNTESESAAATESEAQSESAEDADGSPIAYNRQLVNNIQVGIDTQLEVTENGTEDDSSTGGENGTEDASSTESETNVQGEDEEASDTTAPSESPAIDGDGASDDVGNVVQMEVPVSWTAVAEYDPQTMGSYTFTAAVGEGYTLAEGVEPPSLTVWVMPIANTSLHTIFTEFIIRENGADSTNPTFYDVLNDTAAMPDMEIGTDYFLCVAFKKPANVDAVQIRVGDGINKSANGLEIIQNPGNTFDPTDSNFTDSYFSALLSYDDYAGVEYGADSTKAFTNVYNLIDGEMTYKIASTTTDYEVKFNLEFKIDEALYEGTGNISDAIGIYLGTWDSTNTFVEDTTYSVELDINAAGRNEVTSRFNNTDASASANIGGKSEALQFDIAANVSGSAVNSSALYDTLQFDITYPSNVTIDAGDVVFSDMNSYNAIYGWIEVGAEQDGTTAGTTKRTITIHSGYKSSSDSVRVEFYVTVPDNAGYNESDTFVVSVSNQSMRIGDTDIGITINSSNVTITVKDTAKDYTAITKLEKTVYNSTIDFGTGVAYNTLMGAVNIENTSQAETPYDKTFEASYNTTNAGAMITAISIPMGTNTLSEMGIELTGKKADGSYDTVPVVDGKCTIISYNSFQAIVVLASDYDMTTITGVKAEIGKLPGNYKSDGWTESWYYRHKMSAAYGYFTTDSAGIVVKNTFKIYNTDPSLRNLTNGDLSRESKVTSTDINRVVPQGNNTSWSDLKINDTSMSSKAFVQFAAGNSAKIEGVLGVYGVTETGYNTGAQDDCGTTTMIVDPEIYLLLPDGMSYNDAGFEFSLYKYKIDGNRDSTVNIPLSYKVEDVSYLNTVDNVKIYRISFDKGTYIGLYDGANGCEYKIKYTITIDTERRLATTNYYLNELIQVSSANNITAMPIGGVNKSTNNTVKTDTYGINGGNNLAGISTGGDSDQRYFALSQQEELGVYNAVSVTKIDGQEVTETWYSYDEKNPNSTAVLGANSEGRMQITFNNTAKSDAKDVVLVVPIPKTSSELGSALTNGSQQFSMSMEFDDAELLAAGFTAEYIILDGNSYGDIEVANGVNTWTYTSTTDKDAANAIRITASTITAGNSPVIYLNFKVASGTADAINIWRNAFRYEMTSNSITTTYTGTGNLVASRVATGQVSGTVYFDTNADGVMDANEKGVEGVKVTMTDQYSRVLSTTTDADGKYEFLAVREADQDMTFTISSTHSTGGRFNVKQGTNNTVDNGSDGLTATKSFTASASGDTIDAAVSTSYTLTYDAGDGGTGTLPYSVAGASGSTVKVSAPPDALVKTGYNFVEWNTQKDGNGKGYAPYADLVLTGNITLYAIWEIGTYTVEFNYKGATSGNDISSIEVEYGKTYGSGTTSGELPKPTKPGYTFSHWDTVETPEATKDTSVTKDTLFETGEKTTLYAQWTANTYTISFNGNGNDGGSTPDKPMTYEAYANLTENGYTLTGYDFAGWNTAADGSGISYKNGAYVKNLATEGNTTLYAQWTPKTGYTVIYDLDGVGTTPTYPASGTVSWTGKVIPDTNPVPSSSSYVFAGWSKDPSSTAGRTELAKSTTYAELAGADDDQTNPITIYAIWDTVSAGEVLVNFESEGGTAVNSVKLSNGSEIVSYKITSGADYISDYIPTKSGYDFDGWYTDPNGSGEKVDSANPDDFDTIISKSSNTSATDLTLYANWTAKTYTIEYANVDTAIPDEYIKWDDAVTYPNPIKTGYTFAGWYYNNITEVSSGDTVSKLIPEDDVASNTLTLYARWTENTYTLIYYSDASTYQQTISDVPYTALLSDVPPDKQPTKAGYTFMGWNTDPNKEVSSVTGSTKIADILPIMGTTINLYGAWKEKASYAVNFYSEGLLKYTESNLAWSADNLTQYAPTLSRTGYYDPPDWVLGSTKIISTTTYSELAGNDGKMSIDLYAEWTPIPYDINYDLNDDNANPATLDADNPGTYTVETGKFSFPIPTRPNYDFAGWYDAATGGNPVTSIAVGATGNTILYAHWTGKKYTIEYELDGGDNDNRNPTTYTYSEGKALTDFYIPSKTGNDFLGWFTDTNKTVAFTGISASESGTVTLYAKFEPSTYTITYVLNDGGDSSTSNTSPTSYTYGTGVTLVNASRTGYEFEGWYSDSALTAQVTKMTDTDTDNITLYAKWKREDYKITYELDGGTNHADNPDGYTFGDAFTFKDATKVGYTFDGWYNYSDFATLFPGITATDAGNKTVYAKWKPRTDIQYTVNYYLKDSNTSIKDSITEKDQTMASTVKENAQTIDGYTPVNASETLTLEATGNVINFFYTPNTDIKYTVHYYLYGTANSLFADKEVTDQTMASTVNETAVTIPGYTATKTSETLTLAAANNEITFNYTEKEYTIQYANAEGQSDTKSKWTETITLPSVTKAGYKFEHWTYDGKVVASGTKVSDMIPQDNAGDTLTLTAVWTAKNYTVEYDTDGGDTIASKTNVKWEDANLLPANPSKAGYTFAGWKYGNISVTANTSYNSLAANDGITSIELVAQWTAKNYTVEYDTDGGGTIASKTNVKWEDANLLPADPSKAGYTFDGWKYGGTSVTAGVSYNSLAANDTIMSIELVAQWTAKNYTVEYDTDGGGTIASKTSVKWEDANLLPTDPSKAGYTFDGWKYGSTSVTACTSYNSLAANDDVMSITLVAQWTGVVVSESPAVTYSVEYKANGGSGSYTDSGMASGSLYTIRYQAETGIYYAGYTFTGWNTSADGSGINYTPGADINLTAGITLYAQWSKNTTPSPESDASSSKPDDSSSEPDESQNPSSSPSPSPSPSSSQLPSTATEQESETITATATASEGDYYTLEAYINGYSDGTIKPEANITRAEVAQMFYNIGSFSTGGTSKFSDIASDDWYYDAVVALTNSGLISGYSDGTFRPDESITRAEFATMIALYAELPEGGNASFSDTPSSYWASGYIAAAQEAGYISGYADGTFRPEQNITRAEAISIINKMLGLYCDEKSLIKVKASLKNYSDNTDTSKWYYYDILVAANTFTYTLDEDGNQIWETVE